MARTDRLAIANMAIRTRAPFAASHGAMYVPTNCFGISQIDFSRLVGCARRRQMLLPMGRPRPANACRLGDATAGTSQSATADEIDDPTTSDRRIQLDECLT